MRSIEMLEEKEKYLLSVERYRYRLRSNVQYLQYILSYRTLLPTTRISRESFKTFIDTDKRIRQEWKTCTYIKDV